MFQGVVCGPAREVIAAYAQQPGFPSGAHVLCSGNLSIETTLRLNGFRGRLTGSDVSTYTSALGAAVAGYDLPMALTDGAPEELRDLDGLLRDGEPQVRAAVIGWLLDLATYAGRRNHYELRMWGAMMLESRRASMLTKAAAQVLKKREALAPYEYAAQDAWERVAQLPEDDVVLTFPPTYKGGYEKLYRTLDEWVTWERPAYKELTSGAEFTARVVGRPGPWIVGAEERKAEEETLTGVPVAQCTRGGAKNVYLYSNLPLPAYLVRREVPVSDEPMWARFTDEHEIRSDSVLSVHEVPFNEANYIRQLYISVEVGQSSAQWAYVVCVDGRLVGLLMFQGFRMGSAKIDDETVDSMFMMADLALPSERYPRLSKLVLAAAASFEVRESLRKKAVQAVEYITTTAFSHHPESMKYRGTFKLKKRTREKGLWKLNYYAKAGVLTLAEVMKAWHRKQSSPSRSTST